MGGDPVRPLADICLTRHGNRRGHPPRARCLQPRRLLHCDPLTRPRPRALCRDRDRDRDRDFLLFNHTR